MANNDQSSYIDYDAITAPDFSPTAFANKLVLQTNNPTDTPLDLSTPLSRVLFDVQEVDTHIDTLTTKNALPIIEYTQQRSEAGTRVLEAVEEQVKGLNESYKRLEREVVERYDAAEQVRLAAERMLKTLSLGRAVQRAVQLGRQLDGQMDEVGREGSVKTSGNPRVMVPAANTVLGLRQLFGANGKGEEVEGLEKVKVVTTLRQDVVSPAERALLNRAQQVVREFSMSSLLASSGQQQQAQTQTFAQTEETRTRTTSALQTLYLLSATKGSSNVEAFEPTLLISALQSYLQTALTSSLASIARALATLPTLERTLLEVSARCQNIVALEALLESIKPPPHPMFANSEITTVSNGNANGERSARTSNFLAPLLRHLDTSSLPSYFWRSLAGQLTAKVQEILARGGVSARTLRTNRDRVRDAIRECVDRGSQLPVSGLSQMRKDGGKVGNWEREAAVMVQSVVGPLQR
jgi:hypothetical protein